MEKHGIAAQATDDNVIRRLHLACWITKATNTLGIFFPTAAVVTRKLVVIAALLALLKQEVRNTQIT